MGLVTTGTPLYSKGKKMDMSLLKKLKIKTIQPSILGSINRIRIKNTTNKKEKK
ncbi:MAG: hypothetical protein ACQESC_04495 [Nanobdellota archaeon]